LELYQNNPVCLRQQFNQVAAAVLSEPSRHIGDLREQETNVPNAKSEESAYDVFIVLFLDAVHINLDRLAKDALWAEAQSAKVPFGK
jgi:hypothetical protein